MILVTTENAYMMVLFGYVVFEQQLRLKVEIESQITHISI